jgi:DNA polymerase-1
MTMRDWRELPFRQIWVVDTEFYPGPGLANGGREGDASTPLCLVAKEMRSGRIVQLWQDQFGSAPPYRLDTDVLVVGYMLSAELGTHVALGWGQPVSCLDPYIEFRHLTNDGRIRAGDRDKGFYSLDGALRYFGSNLIDAAHKKEMRNRILQGPPFTTQERADILQYCQDDVEALAALVPHIMPTIRSLPHALLRAKFMWPIAQQERRGVPIDLPQLERVRSRWADIQLGLVTEINQDYGVYEIVDGMPHFRMERFAAYLRANHIPWVTYADGSLDTTAETFENMAKVYPQISPLRELRSTLSKLRLNSLSVGSDARNRALLGPFGTKTSRNAPRASQFAFGPAKWIRFFISPPPGLALVHRDYCQQEVQIAAVLSGDEALLTACATGDVYLGIAKQLGFVPEDATDETHPDERARFKTVVLGIQYGLMIRSLASRTGISLYEAGEILARLRARFRTFEQYAAHVADLAGLNLQISTAFGWTMRCPPGINPRTVRNFPIQSTGSEIMRVACILAERRGVRVVCPVHDAFMAEGDVDQIEDVSMELDRVMRDASRVVLRGYELRTDWQIVRPGERFYDKRGVKMWETVTKLVAKLEERAA